MSAAVIEGQVLAGRYRIERRLGQGHVGIVVAAMDQQLPQRVALKLLHPRAASDGAPYLIREARVASHLKSERVARVLELGHLDTGAPFLAKEYLEGSDLHQALRQQGPFAVGQAVAYLLDACDALAEAHVDGIIHRNLKLANLFLTSMGGTTSSVKVLGFGLSKVPVGVPWAKPDTQLTKTATLLGSPLCPAPEQMRSPDAVDDKADIWSLGVMLYQMLTGRVPFETDSLAELIVRIHHAPPPPPSTFRPDLPPLLDAAILRCLKVARDQRFESVAEFVHTIAPFGSSRPLAQSHAPR